MMIRMLIIRSVSEFLISQSDLDGQDDNENVDNKVYVGVFDILI